MDLEEYYERQARYHNCYSRFGVVAFVFTEEIVAP